MNKLLNPPTGSLSVAELPTNTLNSTKSSSLLLSLILPTYQEKDNIKKMILILSKLLDRVIPEKYELIVVDDCSPDRTWEIALSMMGEYPQLQVMCRTKEKGLSTAVIRGWQAAKGKFLGVIDADLQHPPETLLKLLAEMERGADLVVASRYVKGGNVSEWNAARRFLSRGAKMLGLIILPRFASCLSDPMSGYFIVRRDAIANTAFHPIGYKILIEIVTRCKIRSISEVGYVFQERVAGESKVTKKQYIEYLQHLLRLRLSLLPITFKKKYLN